MPPVIVARAIAVALAVGPRRGVAEGRSLPDLNGRRGFTMYEEGFSARVVESGGRWDDPFASDTAAACQGKKRPPDHKTMVSPT